MLLSIKTTQYLPAGTRARLTPRQLARMSGLAKEIGDGLYELAADVGFKAGEEVDIPDVSKALQARPGVEVVGKTSRVGRPARAETDEAGMESRAFKPRRR